MSLNYFDDPKKQAEWNKEISQIRQEKLRRNGNVSSVRPESNDVFRKQITYEQLLEREYGAAKPQQLSKSFARQMEKVKEMDGIKL